MSLKQFRGLGVILCALFLLTSSPAQAADTTWTGGSGDWNVPGNWDAGVPGAGYNAYLTHSDALDRTVSYISPSLVPLDTLTINVTGGLGGTMTLSQGQDSLSANYEYIGLHGTGDFTQSGGTHTVGSYLFLGISSDGSGGYNLSGGSLSGNYEYIGNSGTGDFTQSGGTHTVGNSLALGRHFGSNGSYDLSNGDLMVGGATYIGKSGTGAFTQTGGTHTVGGNLYLGDGGSGTYDLINGDLTVASNEYIGNGGMATFFQSGGTHAVLGNEVITGNYALAGGGHSVAGAEAMDGLYAQDGGNHVVGGTETISGIYDLSGGTYSVTGTITNIGTLNYSGGDLTADITNAGGFNLSGSGTRTVTGDVTNDAGATIKVTNTTAVFTGTFTNNGAYISDPSDNYFADLAIGADGYLAGGAGDTFHISGDLTSSSAQAALWDTAGASLLFTGSSVHDFSLTGLEMGASPDGYVDNFAWGSIFMDSLSGLNLLGTPGLNALYVGAFQLEDELLQIASITGNGLNIYYKPWLAENAYLLSSTYALAGGGELAPVPEPASLFLLGSGLFGLLGFKRKSGQETA